MDDPSSRLLAAIEETEREAPWVHHKSCASFPVEDDPVTYDCDCGVPASVLRRCAADKRQVDLHWNNQGYCSRCFTGSYEEEGSGGYPYTVLQFESFPCKPLRLLAEAYGLEVTE